MFRKVLLIPASADVEQPAARRALALTAAANGTEIEIFDPAYEPTLEGYFGNREIYEPLRARLVDDRLTDARALAAALEARGRRATAEALWAHPLDRAVADRAARTAADLVVTAPLGDRRGGLSHVDWRLAATCPVPVLFVRSEAAAPYRRIVAAVDPTHAHAKPAELDETILAYAKSLAEVGNADVEVLHCVVPLAELGAAPDVDSATLERLRRTLEEGERLAVRQLVERAGLPGSSISIVAGRPHAVLEQKLEAGDADVVVMGALSRGR